MGIFKRITNTSGKYKQIVVHEGKFVDNETGDQIDIADEIAKSIGEDIPVDISVSMKTDEEL